MPLARFASATTTSMALSRKDRRLIATLPSLGTVVKYKASSSETYTGPSCASTSATRSMVASMGAMCGEAPPRYTRLANEA